MPESYTYDIAISIVPHWECQTSTGVDALNAKFDNRDVLAAAAAGFVGSIVTGGIEYHTRGLQNYHRIPAMIAGGAISSGVASEMMGGDFMDGFYDGLFVAGFNHAMHSIIMVAEWIYEFHEEIHIPKQFGKMDCKYAFMEGAAKQCGETQLTQLFFHMFGEAFIKAYNMEHEGNGPLLTELFKVCGFSVSISEDEYIMPKFGDIIGVEYITDFGSRHIGQMTGYGKEFGTGALVIRLSDPYYGDNHIIYASSVKSYYFINGFQNPTAEYLIEQSLTPYLYYK